MENVDKVRSASNYLQETDRVAVRCFKAGVEFNGDWKVWTEHLREVLRGKIKLDVNKKPAEYPEGS